MTQAPMPDDDRPSTTGDDMSDLEAALTRHKDALTTFRAKAAECHTPDEVDELMQSPEWAAMAETRQAVEDAMWAGVTVIDPRKVDGGLRPSDFTPEGN